MSELKQFKARWLVRGIQWDGTEETASLLEEMMGNSLAWGSIDGNRIPYLLKYPVDTTLIGIGDWVFDDRTGEDGFEVVRNEDVLDLFEPVEGGAE